MKMMKPNIKNESLRYLISPYLKKYIRLIPIVCLLTWSGTIHAQSKENTGVTTKTITGVVRDAKTKEPVVTAQIQSLNYEASATTDDNGEFIINVLTDADVLVVKAFDYNPREIALRGDKKVEIDLYANVFKKLYPEVPRFNNPGYSEYQTKSTQHIFELGNPTSVSADEVLQAQMGGFARTISKSGNKGLGSSMFIRGLNSINLNAQPLIVVDGVFWNMLQNTESLHNGYFINPLSDIDLIDIASISIMKDGTSLYGSKGSNGAIIIKTKRGEDMATQITVNAVGGITDMPASLPVMNGEQVRIYATDLLGTIENVTIPYDKMDFLQDDPSMLSYLKYHNNTDWDKEVYQQGTYQNYTIDVNGGDKRALYAFSMGYTGEKGIVKSVDMQRLNTRFNADFSMSDRIKSELNIGFTNIDRNLLDDGVMFFTSPTYLAMIKPSFYNPYRYTTTGTLTTDVEDSDDFGIDYGALQNNMGADAQNSNNYGISNPTAIIQNSLNTNKQYRLNMGVKPVFQISGSLWFSTYFDYSLDKMKETFYRPIIGSRAMYISGLGFSDNVFRNQQLRNVSLFDDSQLQFKKQFGNFHRVNAIAGLRYIYNNYELDYAEGHNSGSDEKRNLLYEEEFKTTLGTNEETKYISNYANIDYSFDNKYFLALSMTMDGSSRFGYETQGGMQLFDHSWGVFPSINAAWLISSEKFMSAASIIDHLKLRSGYGITGNDGIDPYANRSYFVPVPYMYRANGLILGNIGNSEIQWETSTKLNVGVDVNLLNDRLAISADIYNNNTSDLLTLQELPDVAGKGYYWKNGGELSNKGYEISTNIKLLNTKPLKWEIGGNVGHYVNNVETLPNGSFTTKIAGGEILTDVGNPAGVFYGYKTLGVFTTAQAAEEANLSIVDDMGIQHTFKAGDIHFEEVVEDGIIDDLDKQIIGDPNPDLYGSFNSKIIIGDLSLQALFTFSYGNDIYNYLRKDMESGSDIKNQTTAMLNRWKYEGQETGQPKAVFMDPMGNSRFSDRWIEDGSYLRLKSVSANYQVPINSRFIEGLNIWISANNIWTLTNYIGRDPEVSASGSVLYQGIDMGFIPVCKSYYVGIKMNL